MYSRCQGFVAAGAFKWMLAGIIAFALKCAASFFGHEFCHPARAFQNCCDGLEAGGSLAVSNNTWQLCISLGG
jgi:hypothetical protein